MAETSLPPSPHFHVPQVQPFRWKGVSVLQYKEEGGTHFKSITRQVLAGGTDDLPCEWRYFEISPEGYSTLEKHQHVHAVLILRGKGRCMVGGQLFDLETNDVVNVPPMTWHQFRANRDDHLGFLCLVNCDRDRPIRPGEDDLAELRRDADVAAFIRL